VCAHYHGSIDNCTHYIYRDIHVPSVCQDVVCVSCFSNDRFDDLDLADLFRVPQGKLPHTLRKVLDASPAGVVASKREKEINASEGYVLQVVQLARALSHKETVKTVTEKQVGGLMDKIGKRLSPDLIKLHSESYDSESSQADDDPGMQVLADLRKSSKQLEVMQPLVISLGDVDFEKPTWPGNVLIANAEAARAIGINVHPLVTEIAVSRELSLFSTQARWAMCASLLCSTASADADGKVLSTFCLPESDRVHFQVRELVKIAVDLLRPENNIPAVKGMMKATSDLEVADVFKIELKNLGIMLYPMDDATSTTELRSIKTSFENDKSLKLHKAMTLFPTGTEIMDSVDAAINQRAADRGLLAELTNLHVLRNSAPEIKDATCLIKKDAVLLPNAGVWSELHIAMVSILATASEQFKEKNSISLDDVQSLLSSVKSKLKEAAIIIYDRELEAALALLRPLLAADAQTQTAEETQTTLANATLALDTLKRLPIYAAKDIGLLAVSSTEDSLVKECDEMFQNSKAFVEQLVPNIRALCAGEFSFVQDSSVVFANSLSPQEDDVGGLRMFKVLALTRIKDLAKTQVLETCQPIMPLIKKLAAADPNESSDWFERKVTFTNSQLLVDCAADAEIDSIIKVTDCVLSKYKIAINPHDPINVENADVGLNYAILRAAPHVYKVVKHITIVAECTEETTWVDTIVPQIKMSLDTATSAVGSLVAGADNSVKAKALCGFSIVEKYLVNKAKSLVESATKMLNNAMASIASCEEECSDIKTLGTIVNDLDLDTHSDKLLRIATKPESGRYYQSHKAMMLALSYCGLGNFTDKVLQLAPTPVQEQFSIALSAAEGNKIQVQDTVWILTAAQSLYRPLKPRETRAQLATRCKKICTRLPPKLNEAMDKFALQPTVPIAAGQTAQATQATQAQATQATLSASAVDEETEEQPKTAGKGKPQKIAAPKGAPTKKKPKNAKNHESRGSTFGK
jgi:hypothetical protein